MCVLHSLSVFDLFLFMNETFVVCIIGALCLAVTHRYYTHVSILMCLFVCMRHDGIPLRPPLGFCCVLSPFNWNRFSMVNDFYLFFFILFVICMLTDQRRHLSIRGYRLSFTWLTAELHTGWPIWRALLAPFGFGLLLFLSRACRSFIFTQNTHKILILNLLCVRVRQPDGTQARRNTTDRVDVFSRTERQRRRALQTRQQQQRRQRQQQRQKLLLATIFTHTPILAHF